MKNKKILGLMLAGMMLANVVPQVSFAQNDYNVKRIQGVHRYETAASIAESAFTKSDRAVLVSGSNFADALSAGNLADHAPIFLFEKTDMMQRAINTMRSLDVKEVVIIGGEKSIPKHAEEKLKEKNFKVIRIAGRNRYETSTKLAKQLKVKNNGNVVLANGEKFADALSAAPYAVQKKQTLVLTDGKTLPKDVKAQDVKAIIGGEKSVNIAGLNAKRIAGHDRYETSLEVLKHMDKTQSVVIANGKDYPDALAAAPYAVKKNTGILLSDDSVIDKIKEYVDKQNISDITLIGGEKSVSKYQEEKFKNTSTKQKPQEKPEEKPTDKPEDKKPEDKPVEKPDDKKPEEDSNKLLDVDSPELSAKEKELIKLVNDYREQHGKKRLKVSKSLMKVARTHINDLNMNFDMDNPPVDARGIKGNMHSWSDKGNWTPVVYTKDHKHDKLTKIKPKEIAGYDQTGYEAAVNGFLITPQRALEKWKNSPGHNDMILSQNGWDPTPEEEENGFTRISNMGVAINGDYACIWFTRDDNGIVDPMGYYEFN